MHTRAIRLIAMSTIAVAATTLPFVGMYGAQAQTAAPITRSATGLFPADIQTMVATFRADLGGGESGAANGSFGGKRREINWDGVPDQFSAPNDLPEDFFNSRSPRGVVFSTPGVAFEVSAKAASSTRPRLGNLSPVYAKIFGAFSEERIFTPIGSTVTDVKFFVPGTQTQAVVTGFGAVLTDVDSPESSSIEYYDQQNKLITTVKVPATAGNASQSFAGMSLLGAAKIARVRITAGRAILTGNSTADSAHQSRDKVAMDDFIYGEPSPAN